MIAPPPPDLCIGNKNEQTKSCFKLTDLMFCRIGDCIMHLGG